jgi:hypothetical protein
LLVVVVSEQHGLDEAVENQTSVGRESIVMAETELIEMLLEASRRTFRTLLPTKVCATTVDRFPGSFLAGAAGFDQVEPIRSGG